MIFDKFMVILRGFTFIEMYLFTIVSQTKVKQKILIVNTLTRDKHK